jgi:cupin 2 domain-containing protein
VTGQPNLLASIAPALTDELIEVLVRAGEVRIERIVSMAHRTPPGEWYDQATEEFVLLLRGAAGLRFADEPAEVRLEPGDWLTIPAHRRHRVEWTGPEGPTVWLAVHYPTVSAP